MELESANVTLFRSGWYSFSLPKYRPGTGTYDFYPYESLPPLPNDQFKETLQWLVPLETDIDKSMEPYRPSPEEQESITETLKTLIAAARKRGIYLPDTFTQLLASKDLQDRIPSCTACYFDLSEKLLPCPGDEKGMLIRFLNDQQICVTWYLYLTPEGKHCVLVSPLWLDEPQIIDPEDNDNQDDEKKAISDYIFFCAPSFEAFIYRFWLENMCWYNLYKQKPLTDEQQKYLSHYAQ